MALKMIKESIKMTNPPDYLEGKAVPAKNGSPATLLKDGQWCGHGERLYRIFDIEIDGENIFSFQLPELDEEELNAAVVMIKSHTGNEFSLYDSRKHPASIYHPDNRFNPSEEAELQPTYHCPNCDKQEFQVSVGFEIPSDSELPYDTSWFVLAAKCASCGWEEIVYDDETA